MKEVLFVKFSNERNDKFKIKTAIVKIDGKKFVEKSAANPKAEGHILSMLKNYSALKECYKTPKIVLNRCEKDGRILRFKYIEGIGLDKRLDFLIFDKNDLQTAIEEIADYFDALTEQALCVSFEGGEEISAIFGDCRGLEGSKCCKISNIDAVFSNVILNEDGYNIIDYEWTYEFPIPIKFIEYRIILSYILDNPLRGIIVDNGVFERLGITSEEISIFDKMEKSFQSYVYSDCLDFKGFYESLNVKNHDMLALAQKLDGDTFKNIVDVFYDYGNGVVPESVMSFSNINKDGHGCVEVSVKGSVRAVRIDPITDYCVLSNVDIKAFRGAEEFTPEFGCNGCILGEDKSVCVFNDADVQFYIAADSETTAVRMSYDITSLSEATANYLTQKIKEEKENSAAAMDSLNRFIGEKQAEIEQKVEIIAQKEDEINSCNLKIDSLNREMSEKNSVIDELNRAVISRDSRIEGLNSVILSRDNQIKEIYNSTCWKITAPLRFIVGGTKGLLRNNPVTGRAYEFLFYVKELGFNGAVEHYKSSKPLALPVLNKTEVPFTAKSQIVPLDCLNKSIAVHLHLYYVDLLEEFFAYFNNIPYKFDLFVSCREDADPFDIKRQFKKLKNVSRVEVQKTINRGRDIAPLYVQFGEEISGYDYFLHVHSKKSVYSGKEQYGWRRYSLDCLLKDEETVKKIFAVFESTNIGLFYPETFGEMPIIAQDWLENAGGGRKLLAELGIPFEDGFFNYPVGSFFWARTDAVKPVFDRRLKYDDFPPESGQTDGTLAHILERAIAFVSRSRGYIDAIHDIRSDYIMLGKSYKAYERYFAVNTDNAKMYLSNFDVISFDIFDTLITRKVYMPDDIFKIMQIRAEKEIGIKCDYLKARKKAEELAWNKKGEFTSIDDIYEEMSCVLNISADKAYNLKAMEIKLELEMCVPRRDMLEIFNYLKGCGKKLVLVSDMYLTGDIISDMLKRCGYEGWNDMWISCEKGMRKDTNTMWDGFFDCYGQAKTVHIGDNPQSDIQRVIDRKREAFFVINPRTAFKMSNSYGSFMKNFAGDISASLMLGMFINCGIYNSPFCQRVDGEPDIKEYDTMGYSAFGPLFAAFSLWLNRVTDKDDFLLFLAREGYIFEDFYRRIYDGTPETKRKTAYFLASRRAVSVAAVRSEGEVSSILAQYYRGSLSNLLKSRLGAELYDDIQDRHISMPEELDAVMNDVRPHLEDIFERAEKERRSYMGYINELAIGDKGAVVDVGYSGTIQYYLAKMLESRISGKYLCTSTNRKPEQLDCKCESLYPLYDISEEKTNKIFRNQLFLEAVLKAPFGQLICFEDDDGKIIPTYKDDRIIADELKILQNGILRFADDFGSAVHGIIDDMEVNSELAADMFATCLENGWISDRVADIMTVQDDYCENGSHKFNAKSRMWEIIKN